MLNRYEKGKNENEMMDDLQTDKPVFKVQKQPVNFNDKIINSTKRGTHSMMSQINQMQNQPNHLFEEE